MVKTVKLYTPRNDGLRKIDSRGTAADRGYDYRWQKATEHFRRDNPICQECEREDRIIPMNVVDHKIPIRFRPDLRLDRKNWWSLCNHCHNGIKRRMESYAEKAGKIDLLIEWCDHPFMRPAALTRRRRKKNEENLMV